MENDYFWFDLCLSKFLQALNVFFINIATVTGPTPPGAGVMYPARAKQPRR